MQILETYYSSINKANYHVRILLAQRASLQSSTNSDIGRSNYACE